MDAQARSDLSDLHAIVLGCYPRARTFKGGTELARASEMVLNTQNNETNWYNGTHRGLDFEDALLRVHACTAMQEVSEACACACSWYSVFDSFHTFGCSSLS